jgi:hypothetical protein
MGENDVEVSKRPALERIGLMCDRLEQVAVDPTCTPALPGAILLAVWGIRDALRELVQEAHGFGTDPEGWDPKLRVKDTPWEAYEADPDAGGETDAAD